MKRPGMMLITIFLMLGKMALGQTASSDIELKLYLQSLNKKNINSYVIVEQGCQGCEVEYGTKPLPDDKIIYVLTEADHKITIQKLEKNKVHHPLVFDSISIFKMLEQRKSAFEAQAQYHKTTVESEKTLKFVVPHPTYYPYRIIRVNLPRFKNEVKIIAKESDFSGTYVSHLNWFAPINEMIERILNLAQLNKE